MLRISLKLLEVWSGVRPGAQLFISFPALESLATDG